MKKDINKTKQKQKELLIQILKLKNEKKILLKELLKEKIKLERLIIAKEQLYNGYYTKLTK